MCFHFLQKKKKGKKRLTKYQILSNTLPFFDSVGITKREHAQRGYAEPFNVQIMDSKSLDDSLFLAKQSIKDFYRELLEKKGGLNMF